MSNHENPHMLPKVRSDAIMRAAEGEVCQLRISSFLPGHRCAGADTSVMAHPPGLGKGLSTKVSDLGTIIACHNCHSLLDGVDERWQILADKYPAAVQQQILIGVLATLAILVEKEIIVVPDGEII